MKNIAEIINELRALELQAVEDAIWELHDQGCLPYTVTRFQDLRTNVQVYEVFGIDRHHSIRSIKLNITLSLTGEPPLLESGKVTGK